MTFDTTDSSKRVAKFADESMFTAAPAEGRLPVVDLISANNDPLGQLAFLGKAYQGIFPKSLEEISDEDRIYYLKDGEKNILGMPSEAIMFHFVVRNVTRSFTHQLVRTRHASYAQESLRFAVKEDFPCALPPVLMGSRSRFERATKFAQQMGWEKDGYVTPEYWRKAVDVINTGRSDLDRWRDEFDDHNDATAHQYLKWVEEGWPAEDARGVLPHWILTQVNMAIPLRSLMQMAGQRLCTQAQFEHRMVWDGIIRSLREYGQSVTYRTNDPQRWTDKRVQNEIPDTKTFDLNEPWSYVFEEVGDHNGHLSYERSSAWQFERLAERFKPICYQTGRCQFRSDFDRFCNIRDRVEANHSVGRPSSEWHLPIEPVSTFNEAKSAQEYVGIPAIQPFEWLDKNAAIRPDGNWRSAEAKANIEGRRL